MLFNVYDYIYTPSASELVQGKRMPKNTVAGSNGSYITIAEKAQLILRLKNTETGVGPDIDIAPRARYVAYNIGTRLTKKKAVNLGESFIGKVVDVDQDRKIKNIDNLIYNYL